MTSYQFAPSPRKRKVARFITKVRRELQKAFMEEKAARGLTQTQVATAFGVHRSIVCRQLSGSANLTLRTLGDYAWVLDRDPFFSFEKPLAPIGSNKLRTDPSKEDMPASNAPTIGQISRIGIT